METSQKITTAAAVLVQENTGSGAPPGCGERAEVSDGLKGILKGHGNAKCEEVSWALAVCAHVNPDDGHSVEDYMSAVVVLSEAVEVGFEDQDLVRQRAIEGMEKIVRHGVLTGGLQRQAERMLAGAKGIEAGAGPNGSEWGNRSEGSQVSEMERLLAQMDQASEMVRSMEEAFDAHSPELLPAGSPREQQMGDNGTRAAHCSHGSTPRPDCTHE